MMYLVYKEVRNHWRIFFNRQYLVTGFIKGVRDVDRNIAEKNLYILQNSRGR